MDQSGPEDHESMVAPVAGDDVEPGAERGTDAAAAPLADPPEVGAKVIAAGFILFVMFVFVLVAWGFVAILSNG